MKKVMKIMVSIMIVVVLTVGAFVGVAYAHGFRYDSEDGLNKYYVSEDGRYYTHAMHLDKDRALAIWNCTSY